MKFIQNLYRRHNMMHEYLQIIFCFDEGIETNIVTLREVCERIGQVLITDKRQVLGAIHYLNTDKIHCHYLINYVGIDGKLYIQGFSVLHYKKQVNEVLIEYDFQPIRYEEHVKDNKDGFVNNELANFCEDKTMDNNISRDSAISVDELRRRNPSVEIKGLEVNYSNEIVRRIEAYPNYSSSQMMDTAISPYGYLQSGYGMTVLYPDSMYYLLNPQFLLVDKSIERTTTNYIYEESMTTLFWIRRNKEKPEKIPLANFEVRIEKIYTLVDTNAQEKRIKLLIKGKEKVTMDIFLDKMFSLYQELIKTNPEYRLYTNAKIQTNSLFQQYVSEIYESNLACLPQELVYKNAGWQTTSNGCHYYSGTDENCQSQFFLATIDTEIFDLVDWVGSLLEIGDHHIMLPLLLHAHFGYTLKLFEDAGYNEQYILAMIGVSGSKKTSLARVMFELFWNALINFTSTDRAIELELMNRQDSTLIMDDLSCGSDKFLAGKFEKILRQLGDATGRKRSTKNGTEQESVNTRCAVVLTDNGLLLQSRLYNTYGGTRRFQADSSVYRDLIQREISELEGVPNIWKTFPYVTNKIGCHISCGTGFGGYSDWHYSDFDAKISLRADHQHDFKNFSVGTFGLCVSCGKEICHGLYCEDCKTGDDEICDECHERCDSITGVYNRNGEYIHVCDNCLHEFYRLCDDCDEYHHEDNITVIDDCTMVCANCLEENYFKCESCDDYFNKNNRLVAVDCDGNEISICDICKEENYKRCDDCGRWVHYDDSYTAYDSDGKEMLICPACRDRDYSYCKECDELFHDAALTDGLCANCLKAKEVTA